MTSAGKSELDRVAEEAALDAALDKLAELERLLGESEADRAARLELIHARDRAIGVAADKLAALERQLVESEGDRAARLELIHARDRALVDSGKAINAIATRCEALEAEVRTMQERAACLPTVVASLHEIGASIRAGKESLDATRATLAIVERALETSGRLNEENRQAIESTRNGLDELHQADARILAALEARADRDAAASREALAELSRVAESRSAQAAARSDDAEAQSRTRDTELAARISAIEARLARGFFARVCDALRGR